jgi:hypothetical protein
MPYTFSNYLLLFPVACALALVSAGLSETARPVSGWVRLALGVTTRVLFLLVFVGMVWRASPLQLIWVTGAIGVMIAAWFWERELVKRALLQILGLNLVSPARMTALAYYLEHHTRGLWRRRGVRLGDAFRTTGSWLEAVERGRLPGDVRTCIALRLARESGNCQLLEHELTRDDYEHQLMRVWLGKLWPTLLTALLLLVWLGSMRIFFWPVFRSLCSELLADPWPAIDQLDLNSGASNAAFYLLGLATFLFSTVAIGVRWFPRLLWYQPCAWLGYGYFRGATLRTLAEVLRRDPDLPAACSTAARVMPVAMWSGRLRQATGRMLEGMRPAAALHATGILSQREATAMEAACAVDSVPAVLEEIAEHVEQRFQSRYLVTLQLFVVATVLLLAWLVFWNAHAMWRVLTLFIEELARP